MMKLSLMVSLFVAITDRSWFDLLSGEQPDEVNFWQPSGTRNFGAISAGELFLFKLHAPDDFIVGGGVFSHASNEHIPAFRTYTRGQQVRVRYLTQDQARALLAELPAHQAAVVLFALATGLRQGNILDLTWARVDMTRRIATIEHGDTKNGDALGVPLNDVAMGVLAKERGKHETHVFTFRGAPLRNANNRAWRAALKACGIENFRWHDLRHTWATWLRQNDVPTWVLQELGGWKSETMVRRYAHMSVKHLQPYADQLIFEGQTGHTAPKEEMPRQGHKSGHSDSPMRLKLVAGTDLSR